MTRSYVLLVLCVFIWALNYISRQYLLREFSPLLLSALSLTLVSCVFLIGALFTRSLVKVTRNEIMFLLLSAVIGLIANQIFLFQGLKYTTATNASLIFTLSPLITAGLSAAFLKEKVTWRMIAGCVTALAGLCLALNTNGLVFHAGDLLLFGATFTFSCNLIFTRFLSRRLSPFIITVYSFGLSALFFDPFVLAFSGAGIEWNHSWSTWGLLLVSVLVAQGLTGVMWNKGMQTVGAAKASIVLNLQPLMTMMLELLLFRHSVSFQQVFGISLVFIGVLFATLQLGYVHTKKKSRMDKNNNNCEINCK
ncbi:S-adenosylmethionine/S-adenosylhomocysteine transporter [Paenibacillus konkukensis]|uniref:S-adenosylmethionine/S-adenosylhomocysteine transporter n=1 Tax=Paenibacillus konkukensis TaxID=2020716 RepID=A0ABY4RNL5_9BACL|nr:DMT family transporter [Paenibacillus konkukensis]UQZ82912.1 S-adenosylmethionine/S-adenosylhomocysteine transporter [Paenibacillus konkukensis]